MLTKRAVIFGGNGQDGFFLKKLLESKNIISISVSRNKADLIGDVSCFNFVKKTITQNNPNYIFHLAADSTIDQDSILLNNESIVKGTLNILEVCRLFSKKSKIFISGSAIQFVNNGHPISEKDNFEISNAYSLMRTQSVLTARYYRDTFNIQVFVGYLFNHDSEMRSGRHINQKIVQTLNRIKNGSNEKLQIDDPEYRKEFNYAGDIVEAMWKLINQEKIHECVIGCGKTYSIMDWIKTCSEIVDLDYKKNIVYNNKIGSTKILVSNPETIYSIGWKPKKTFYDLAEIMMRSKT
tara:strand:+ start:891 stop:1775 length:885 start_codon:yes stop_codon:yes gene_type:complete